MPEKADSIAVFCLEESFEGVSTTTLTNRSPVVLPRKEPAPRSRNLNILPVCVSGGILSNTFQIIVECSALSLLGARTLLVQAACFLENLTEGIFGYFLGS